MAGTNISAASGYLVQDIVWSNTLTVTISDFKKLDTRVCNATSLKYKTGLSTFIVDTYATNRIRNEIYTTYESLNNTFDLLNC